LEGLSTKAEIASPTLVEAWEKTLERWETNVEDVIMRYLDRQRKVIIARLLGVKTRKAVLERGRPLEVKAIVDELRWRQELTKDLTSAFRDIYISVGSDVLAQIDPTMGFNPQSMAITADVFSITRNATAVDGFEVRITALLEKHRDRIRKKSDLEDLAARLTEEYSAGARNFARRLSGSTTAGAVNGGSYEGASQSGRVRSKTWVTVGDHKVRNSHKAANGTTIPNDQLFLLGSGSAARFPNDPTLPAKDWINCRCSVVYSVPDAGQDPLAAAGEALANLLGLG
jgi:hypothetical protein